MTDPFRIEGPANVNFSGGRTSAYMLWRILEAHGGTLPDDVHVLFANTGRERPETLDFVAECASRWDVRIVWLEWRDGPHGQRFEEVSHNSASRAGEPFEALIDQKGFPPNQVTRYCTEKLKIEVMRDFMRAQGHRRRVSVIGLRADESHRVLRARAGCKRRRAGETKLFPLHDAGTTKADVMAFWAAQPFDLRLEDHEGNCDLCFLKSKEKLRRIMYDRPDLAAWWIEQENRMRSSFRPPDRPSYRQLYETRRRQESFDFDAADMDCNCTD